MVQSIDLLPADLARHRILDAVGAAAFCNYSVAHWRRLHHAGKAPPPIRLGSRKYGWQISDLIDWIEAHRDRAA